MKPYELIQWARRQGFTEDRYGHMVLELGGRVTRLKITKISARWEIQASISGKNEWLRQRSGYLSKLSITADDKLSGLTR